MDCLSGGFFVCLEKLQSFRAAGKMDVPDTCVPFKDSVPPGKPCRKDFFAIFFCSGP